jgi:hypothetical protein
MDLQNRSILSTLFLGGHRDPQPAAKQKNVVTEQPESLPASPSKRPIAIAAICVLSGMGVLFTIPLIFSAAAASFGAWYPPFLAVSSAVGAACTVGFWLMRRWAVYLYAGLCLSQIVLLAMGSWNIVALLIPLAVVIIGFIYLPCME